MMTFGHHLENVTGGARGNLGALMALTGTSFGQSMEFTVTSRVQFVRGTLDYASPP